MLLSRSKSNRRHGAGRFPRRTHRHMQDQSRSIENRFSSAQRFRALRYARIFSLILLAVATFVAPAFAQSGSITIVAGIKTLAGTGSPGLATSPTQANTAPLL